MPAYRLETVSTLPAHDQAAINRGSSAHLPGLATPVEHEPLLVALRDAEQALVGGAVANTGNGWCYLSSLWVHEPIRGQGWGSRILALVEAEAQRRGCRHLYLNTFSDQALEFYLQNGYRTFAVLEDFPGERQRVFLRKDFAAGSAGE